VDHGDPMTDSEALAAGVPVDVLAQFRLIREHGLDRNLTEACSPPCAARPPPQPDPAAPAAVPTIMFTSSATLDG